MDYVVFYVPSRSAEARCLVIEGSEAQPCLFRNLVKVGFNESSQF